ncbi:hypothetical protein BIY45_12445 [Stenotrophomonas sp. BIIR7]|nr:hypothetical protein BIY45_12445 [Stenotrophomonas sp. BIIR7]
MVHDAMRIAYAPAAYYRPWQALYANANHEQQRWLNGALIRQRRLPMPTSLAPPPELLPRRLIGLWPRLPQVASLMAAARLRDWLPSQRGCAALPPTLHAFMRAGHASQPASVVPAHTDADLADTLLLWGGAEVQALAPQLPSWLSARLSLPFASAPADPARPPTGERADLDLFWTAVTYVEKLS